MLFLQKKSTYVSTDSPHCLLLKLDQMEKVLEMTIPLGVSYAKTDSEDEKWRAELEERKKLREARKAAKAENEKKDEAKKGAKEEGSEKKEDGRNSSKDSGDHEERRGSNEDGRAHSGYFYD